MTRLVLATALADDIERITLHMLAHDVANIDERIDEIYGALALLREHPLIGRPGAQDRRELVIGRDTRGYVARYRYDPLEDTVIVLALRAQRELGFARD